MLTQINIKQRKRIVHFKKLVTDVKNNLLQVYSALWLNTCTFLTTVLINVHEQMLDYLKDELEIFLIRFAPETSSHQISITLFSQILINLWQKYSPSSWNNKIEN